MLPLRAGIWTDASTRDQRSAARRMLRLEVSASSSQDAATALIPNLSEAGLLLETSADLQIGDVLQVHMPHAGATTALVVWSRGNFAGCEFVSPVTKGAVSAALLKNVTEQAQPVPAPSVRPESDPDHDLMEEEQALASGTVSQDSGAQPRFPHRSSGPVMKVLPLVAGSAPNAVQAPMSLNHILRAVRTHLGMEVGFISEFANGRRVFRHVESADGNKSIEVGDSDPLEESYCHWIAQGKLPQLIRDPGDHPFTASLAVTKSLPVGAHLSVPIRVRNGEIYGTFCCFSSQPDPSLTDRDLATMEAFAQIAGEQIQQAIDSDEVRQTKLRRITSILEKRDLEMVYQPAIRLDEPGVEFVEALARFRSKPYRPPDEWFAAAAEVGLGAQLEMLAVRLALEGLQTLPETAVISINVSPQTAASEELAEVLSSVPLHRIILEVTEHEAVKFYGPLTKALKPLRKQGLRIAVDDTGAGYSSFRHILQMRPELIKLDMSLSRGIDRDPSRRALAAALIWFAREIGSKLVAEGVETARELRTLRDLGVKIVQGHLFARPAPAGEIDHDPADL